MTFPSLILLVALAPADAPTPPDAPPPPSAVEVDDTSDLQGEWEAVAVWLNGKGETAYLRGERWVFDGDSLAIYSGNRRVCLGLFTADPSRSPHEVDCLEEFLHRRIYLRQGDWLFLAEHALILGPRPTNFADSNVEVWQFRRVKR
jgi:uncharacterized protein (TIGR03067 family)